MITNEYLDQMSPDGETEQEEWTWRTLMVHQGHSSGQSLCFGQRVADKICLKRRSAKKSGTKQATFNTDWLKKKKKMNMEKPENWTERSSNEMWNVQQQLKAELKKYKLCITSFKV